MLLKSYYRDSFFYISGQDVIIQMTLNQGSDN